MKDRAYAGPPSASSVEACASAPRELRGCATAFGTRLAAVFNPELGQLTKHAFALWDSPTEGASGEQRDAHVDRRVP
jgi:hypothetical protein